MTARQPTRRRAASRRTIAAALTGLVALEPCVLDRSGGVETSGCAATRPGGSASHSATKDAEGWVTEGWWNVSAHICETLLRWSRVTTTSTPSITIAAEMVRSRPSCARATKIHHQGTEDCLARGFDRTGYFRSRHGETARAWTVQLTESSRQTRARPACPARSTGGRAWSQSRPDAWESDWKPEMGRLRRIKVSRPSGLRRRTARPSASCSGGRFRPVPRGILPRRMTRCANSWRRSATSR